ncbi:enoyl-CoA hydratase/isomerase family protein [Rhodobacter maris]|uniref:3-hydroxyacyl-CoA dehydrogenase n=1 Tax=Rhodobacter maris TaxID=446682 RepID=A0A285RFL4_9RHOB|nr:enoyl-CoA hydratase/isomerase family protein [Rhodobacter maris]SOB92870.1 3-hydroxyacyl-CoA dehydrogenase [Rhodobacter maris]
MERRVWVQRQEGMALVHLGGRGPREAAEPDRGFDAELRAALDAVLTQVFALSDLQAVVLRGGAGGWPSAADPAQDYAPADTNSGVPGLADLCARIAAAPVPVIAVLTGRISGGALALSQAAALRLALPTTQFTFPEPALGLIPAAGGTVRLARRAGGAAVLEALLAPHPLGGEAAMRLGLCDALASEGTIEATALAEALRCAEGAAPFLPQEAAFEAAGPALDALVAARARLAPGHPAAWLARLIEVIEAALLLPLAAALDVETVVYEDLRVGTASAALRHLARARRRAQGLAGPAATVTPVARVTRLALWNPSERQLLALLGRGLEVQFGASSAPRLEALLIAVAQAQEAAFAAGRIDAARREADWARLEPVAAPEDFLPADLLIAVPSDAAELAGLRAARDPAVPLVLSGALPGPGEIGLDRAPGFAAIWPGGPAEIAELPRLAAVLRADGTQVIAATALALRLEVAWIAAAERAVLAGASPAEVDAALTRWGFAEGPFARLDALGLATVQARFVVAGRQGRALVAALAGTGRAGRAAGAGVYDYPDGKIPQPRPGEAGWLSALRLAEGITAPARLSAAEIVARVLAEIAGEGAAALQTGRAYRASDIDLAAVAALGIAPERGGPMFEADRIGVLALRKRLRALIAEGAPLPAPLLDRLIRDGRGFLTAEGGGSIAG